MNLMQAVLLKPLPFAMQDIAHGGAREPLNGDSLNGDAWQRELQRAQSSFGAPQAVAFLQGFGDIKLDPAPIAFAPDASAAGAALSDSASIADAPPRRADVPAQAASESSPLAAPGGAAIAQPTSPYAAQGTRAAVTRAVAGSPVPVSTANEATPRPPVRVHADWSAEGVRIWLGIDANTASAVQSIASQLQRWLVAQGVRGMTIACNGRAIVEHWPDASPTDSTDPLSIEPKEKP